MTPLVVLRLTRTESDPETGAATLSDCVAEADGSQPWPVRAGFTLSVPDDGVTVSPLGSGTACQCTVVAVVPADATPIWSVVDCPAVTVVPPLGSENPTAGSCPVPKDGGARPGEVPQSGSAVPARV